MDIQNYGLEKVTPLKRWSFLVSMLNFWGVDTFISEPSEGVTD